MPILAIGLAACTDDDLGIDEATCGAPEVFRIERIEVPANNAQARELGQDLNGDQTVDNQLGMIAATLSQQFANFDLAASATARLGSDVDWRISLRRCGDGMAISTTIGEPSGDELQMIDPSVGDGIVATANELRDAGTMPVGALFDATAASDAGFTSALRSRIALTDPGDADQLTATLGMALEHPAAKDIVTVALTPTIVEQASSGHSVMLDVFDTAPRDGVVTPEEVAGNNLLLSLLTPDIETRLGHGLSFGIRLHATRVR